MHLRSTQGKVLPNDALSVVAGIDRDQKLPTFCLDVFLVVCWSMPVCWSAEFPVTTSLDCTQAEMSVI